jgi:hypothetical protein
MYDSEHKVILIKIITGIFLVLVSCFCNAQQPAARNTESQKIDTANLDLKAFSQNIFGSENDDYEKARKLLYWLSSNFEWKATDYKKRTVKEIIARNGGNCFELAKVYMALIKEAGIPHRAMAEINIHRVSQNRQASAAAMVKEKGNSMSVFGLQHNDHRWVEIFDQKNNAWQPADPSMGVIGLNDWLKARVWFGERKTIDTSITNMMVVPFAIFVTGSNGQPVESRTSYYLVDAFNSLYGGKLSELPGWNNWIERLDALTQPAKNAFLGKENLHMHQSEIRKLAEQYQSLKQTYLQKWPVASIDQQ